MKTAISVPDPLFESADRLAERLGLSRSELYQRAIARFVAEYEAAGVTERLDRVYATHDDGVDPVLARLQEASLEADSEWPTEA